MADLMDMGFAGAYYGMQDKLRKDAMARDEAQLKQAAGAVSLADMLRKAGQAQVEQQRAEQFRAAVAGLGPNPTQEQLATVGSQFASPQDLLKTHQQSLDRQATIAATKAAQEAAATERRDRAKELIDFRYDQLAQSTANEAEKRVIEQRRLADKAEQDRRHDITMRMIAGMRADASQAGKVPAGYRTTPEGNLQAIPGGPADTKIQGALNQDTAALEGSTAALNRLGEQVNLVKNSNLSRITGIAGALPNIPGLAGADAKARLDALKSQVGFSVMQALKDASKTGSSGLGQITEREHVYLQQQLGNLETAQSEEQLRLVLDDIEKFVEEAKGRIRNAYNMKHKDSVPQKPSPNGSGRIKFDANGNQVQ